MAGGADEAGLTRLGMGGGVGDSLSPIGPGPSNGRRGGAGEAGLTRLGGRMGGGAKTLKTRACRPLGRGL